MCKKTVAVLIVIINILFFTVNAASVPIKQNEKFYAYGEDNAKISEITGMKESELDAYCKDNNITFFAVDSDNKRQIKLIEYTTDFSSSIVDISLMTVDNIESLIPEIVGVEDATGEVLEQGGQKFIKTQALSEDSGGEYILTSYFTVANRKNYVLVFLNHKSEDTDYTKEIFENYAKGEDFGQFSDSKDDTSKNIILIGIIAFAVIFVIIGITVIKDLRKNKETE